MVGWGQKSEPKASGEIQSATLGSDVEVECGKPRELPRP